MVRHTLKSLTFAALVLVSVALVFAFAAGSALAQSDPTLGLAALHAKLDESGDGTVSGYFKTVDKGSTIETIPVTILAITGGPTAKDALIMFEATGSQINKFGGIVAGMSGSPIYISDNGTDTIVGAVSYGDYFTKGGTGLATPIEAMQLVQSTYLPEFLNLAKPLITTDGLVNSIVVAPNPQDFSAAAKQGAFVASPLSSVFIGGLDPSSLGYKALAKLLANRGQSVVPLIAPLGSTPAVGDQSFETTLVPGASVAAMETRGDMWIGGVGTVTYTDTDTVLAFGHSALWSGPSSLYMTNAWVDDVWPSSLEPYKVARPGAVRGTITQDRSAGILGLLGHFSAETTFTAHAFDTDSSTSATSTVYMPRQMLDAATIDPITAALGVYVAGQNLMDAQQTPGSAEITTTVLATDGTTTYTVSMPDRIDSAYDVPLAAIQDAATAINTLQQVPTDGVHTFDLLSVDLTARFTTRRNWAQIASVQLPKGLKVGANPVRVSARVYGMPATQTINATITVPSGTPLTGSVVAMSQSTVSQGQDTGSGMSITVSNGDSYGGGVTINIPDGPSHTSLAEAVSGLNSTLPNNVVTLMFVPSNPDSGQDSSIDFPYSVPSITPSSILATVSTDWAFFSAAKTSVTQISAAADPRTVAYGGETLLTGTLTGPSTGATVAVYATPAGGTEQYVGTLSTSMGDTGLEFETPVGPLWNNTSLRIHYEGANTNASADAIVVVGARARVVLGSSASKVKSGRTVKLKATVWPATTGGAQIVFEYNTSGKHWRAIATRTLVAGTSSATTSTAWKTAKGKHKVRARFLGAASNAASTSAAITVTGT